jgi:hypothetical protein
MPSARNRVETNLLYDQFESSRGAKMAGWLRQPVTRRSLQDRRIRMLRLAQVLDVNGFRRTKIYELERSPVAMNSFSACETNPL